MKLFSFLPKKSNKKLKPDNFSLKINGVVKYYPKNNHVFREAVTHKSIDKKCNYERLEFLGDSILDAVVSKFIFRNYLSLDEGELTQLRSKLVSRKSLNRIGRKLNLDKVIISSYERNELPENMFGNVLEAIVGAIYLDGGQQAAENFIQQNLTSNIGDPELEQIDNHKGKLLEWGSKNEKIIEFSTSPCNYAFKSVLLVNNDIMAEGKGKNKKSAEQEAAKIAIQKLKVS